jgi:hypothetical protein
VTLALALGRALVVAAESLIGGKRVVIIGDSSLNLHELVGDLGARVVHVFDPDASRPMAQPAPTHRATVLRALPAGDFDVRDGAYDLAIVPDLTVVDDAAALLARLRRIVGSEGAVLCAARNVDADGEPAGTKGIGYYELYDLVALQFASVRMIAAMPFTGLTLAELGQDEVESAVRVDTQLASDRPPPEAYVALASQEDLAVDAYAVIELPAEAKAAAPPKLDAPELATARLRIEYLEGQLEEVTTARAARTRAEESERRALDALDTERATIHRLEQELDHARNPPVEDVEPFAELADKLAQTESRAATLEEALELADKTLVTQRQRIAELESQARPHETDISVEVVELESKLKQRATVVATLEAEVKRRDKMIRELIARLEGSPATEAVGDLPRKLEELARLAAKQKSDLEAQAWRIGELEALRT